MLLRSRGVVTSSGPCDRPDREELEARNIISRAKSRASGMKNDAYCDGITRGCSGNVSLALWSKENGTHTAFVRNITENADIYQTLSLTQSCPCMVIWLPCCARKCEWGGPLSTASPAVRDSGFGLLDHNRNGSFAGYLIQLRILATLRDLRTPST